tara:strand:+ start:4991 stop:5479 length:489 start_codon:yes stop_codon:yes gene_type:complete
MVNQAHGSASSGYTYTTPRTVYKIKTFLDISNTGIVSDFRDDVPLPFVDDLGNIINNRETWSKSRNEQRNWETFIQAISLRAQPIMTTSPVKSTEDSNSIWTFNFGVETADVYANGNDEVGLLKDVLHNVPIITGLNETASITVPMIDTHNTANTWCYIVEA